MTSDLAIKASMMAFDSSDLRSKDIDCVIVATTTLDETFPSTASKVQIS